jgi:hypothetical protein
MEADLVEQALVGGVERDLSFEALPLTDAAEGTLADTVVPLQGDSTVRGYAAAIARYQGGTVGELGALSTVSSGDTLTLVAHGNIGSVAGMNAAQLADFITASGAQPDRIQLMSCYSSTVAPDLAELLGIPVQGANGLIDIPNGIPGAPQIRTTTGLWAPYAGFQWY